MEKGRYSSKNLAYCGVLVALNVCITLVVRIPMPYTNGYFNVGDAVIFLSGLLFNPIYGLIVGGLGSCLADIIGGYPHWAVPTLIIKGCEGLVVGLVFCGLKKIKLNRHIAVILSMLVGGLVMVAGYFVAGGIMGGFGSAVLSLGGNGMQGGISLVIAYVVLVFLSKAKLKSINNPLVKKIPLQ